MTLKTEINEDAEPLGEPPSFTHKPEEQVERSMDLPTRLRRFLNRTLKSQSGFSLAELMVAVGVSGALALGTMKLAELQTQAQITDEILTAQQNVQILLKNSNACTNSFAGLNVSAFAGVDGNYNGGVNAFVNVPNIKNPSGGVFLPVSPGAPNIVNNLENSIDRSNQYVVYGNLVMVQHIRITNVRSIAGKDKQAAGGLNRSGIAEVEIMFAIKDNRRGVNSKIVRHPKHILFPVTFTQGGVISECRMPEDLGVQETERDLCLELGGSFDANNRCRQAEEAMTDAIKQEACTQLGGSFNSGNDSCVPSYYGCRCAAGSIVSGFGSNGRPICVDAVSGAPTALNCTTP